MTVDCHLLTNNVSCSPPATDIETKGTVLLSSHSLRRTSTSEKPNFEQVTYSHMVRQYQASIQITNQPPPPLCATSDRIPKQPGGGSQTEDSKRGIGEWERNQNKNKGNGGGTVSPKCNLPPGGEPCVLQFSLCGLSVC